MNLDYGYLSVRLALSEEDQRAAERLRYRVFVEELGGDGPLVDHAGRFERDEFDPFYDHLLLIDERKDPSALEHVVGVYRLLTGDKARSHGSFYSEGEYDLSVLKNSRRRLLELGRSCIAAEYRGGLGLHMLWQGLTEYVRKHEVEVLFGVASLHGTDVDAHAMPLSHLHHAFLAPQELRVRAVDSAYQSMNLIPAEKVDRIAAMRAVPPLIKSYLRLGGFVGDGAFVDHAFNTTDVCLVMDTEKMNRKALARLTTGAAK